MEFGKVAIVSGLVLSILSVILYVASLGGNRKMLMLARAVYMLTAGAAISSFGRLMYLCANHRFEFQYVMDYSSEDLKFPFSYAATWAGQEGSFLLWMLWTALIGILVMWKAGKWENRVMPFYIASLCFLFAILTWLSPFGMLPRGGENGFPMDLPWPPQFGKGLHPSLQNYWMAIHPPTIFFGFTALSVPFAYAIASLIWKEYTTWAPRVLPWTLMAVATLGVGLFMGGYWAYETLGWHGFWAWDPVENASLFPWLCILGLLHGLIVQKSKGAMVKTNLLLAVVSWTMFLYGTYLTRSGVLSNFSVHSFVSLASQPLILIIVMIGTAFIGGMGLLAVRWSSIPGKPISEKPLSRDTGMVMSVSLLVLASVIIAIGTSWPLISQWSFVGKVPLLKDYYNPKGMALQPIFFNKIGSVLLIPGLIFMGMIPFLAWGKTNVEKFLWKVLAPWFSALAGGALILWYVLHEQGNGFVADTPRPLVVVVGTLGLFCAFANLALVWKLLRVKAVTMGGWLAHVGIGLMMVGTIISNVYEKTETYALVEGIDPIPTPFGYSVQYAGWTHDGKDTETIRKEWFDFDHAVRVKVSKIEGTEGAAKADGDSASTPRQVADATGTDVKGGFMTPGSGKVDVPGETGSYVANLPVFKHRKLMGNAEQDQPETMRWPYIQKTLLRDFYMSVASDPKLIRAHAELLPGESQTIGIPGLYTTKYTVSYNKFYMEGQPGKPGTVMGADMTLTTPDGKNISIRPGSRLTPSGMERANEDIPEVQGAVIIDGRIDVASKKVKVAFEFPDHPALWMVPLSVTNKPMINLVWLGVILMGIGSLCAMLRRALEARGITLQAQESQGVPELVPVAAPTLDGGSSALGAEKGKRFKPAKTRPAD